MIRNSIFTICLLFILSSATAQELTGTWTPVSFKLGNIMEGTIASSKLTFFDTTGANEGSEAHKFQEMMGKMLIDQLTNLNESYNANGVLAIKTGKGKEQGGFYKFDAVSNTLKRGRATIEEETYQVLFKEGQRMQLTTKITTPKGEKTEFIIEFERVLNQYKF